MAVVPNRNDSERSMNVSFAEGEGSAATNKERFEKLKASRQKYKDQATEAKLRCINLERQLSMLVQQLESSAAAGVGVGVGNGNDDEGKARMEAEIRELKARLASATATVDKLDDQLADCARRLASANALLAKAHSDAKEWRAKAERATSTMVGGGGAYEYVCGAVLGAGTVAAAGYVALTYMMKR